MSRLGCWLFGHVWSEYEPTSAYRRSRRHCKMCPAVEVEPLPIRGGDDAD